MSRHRIPALRRHKPSSKGVVTLNGRDYYVGPWPASARKAPKETLRAYDKLINEWLANDRQPAAPKATSLPIVQVVERFWSHVEQYYRRPDGTQTSEVSEFRYSLRPLVFSYGDLPINDLTPMVVKAVRQMMLTGYQHDKYGPQPPLSRKLINKRIGRILRMVKWAKGEGLTKPEILEGIRDIKGLGQGRCDARETEPVEAVADAAVEAVLPFVSAEIKAMIQLQRLTGMRPMEVCLLRACDVDMGGEVWIYRPPVHKMAYRNKPRVIAIGPRGQQIVREFLQLDTTAYLFSPRRAKDRYYASIRQRRKSKVQPSQVCRKKRKPEKAPRERYDTSSYCQAVSDACDRAYPAPEPLARMGGESLAAWQRRLTAEQKQELRSWQHRHRWSPNQLRHSHATEVRRQFGLEAAQVALGHSQANVTQIYAERDLALAAKVAAALG